MQSLTVWTLTVPLAKVSAIGDKKYKIFGNQQSDQLSADD
jgi:hypothetical protein